MNLDKVIEMALYAVPSLITGGVAYGMFTNYFKDQQNTRRWLLQKENQKNALPLRLQAYERMALFLERINITKIVTRVVPFTSSSKDYSHLLIQTIEQEFEHNLTQQIYLTNESWTMIVTAKNAIIQNIRQVALENTTENADAFREKILNSTLGKENASQLALSFLKSEVLEFM